MSIAPIDQQAVLLKTGQGSAAARAFVSFLRGPESKAIIRRYIKRNLQKIQHCYEKELVGKPNLSGTVMTNFLINPQGTVTHSTGSGVDPEVASCVAEVIRAIEFPKPKGGGNVQVNYPFIFRLGGGG